MVSGPGCRSTAAENLHRPWTAGYLYNLVLAFRLRDYCKEHEHHINAHSAVEGDRVGGDEVARALPIPIPQPPFGIARSPSRSVPTRLPAIVFPEEKTTMPHPMAVPFPETKFPSPTP